MLEKGYKMKDIPDFEQLHSVLTSDDTILTMGEEKHNNGSEGSVNAG